MGVSNATRGNVPSTSSGSSTAPSRISQASGQFPSASQAGRDRSYPNLEEEIISAIIHIVAETAERTQSRRKNHGLRQGVSARRRTRRRSRRRTRQRRLMEDDSDTSMYEVIDCDYSKISKIKTPPTLDWRTIPRYELKPSEIAKQEKELFYLLTSESKPELEEKVHGPEPPCCVCKENIATRVVVPCGHRCLCRPCALYIATNRSTLGGSKLTKRCPICQAAIGLMPRLR